MRVYIEGIGLCGPGLPGWPAGAEILAGRRPYGYAPTVIRVPDILPPGERRRAVPTVKLALAVGIEAIAAAGQHAADIATVFTSSGGDGETLHSILETLAAPERAVSPTRFHNSVHNAPAGYWGIATGAQAPSTSLCAYDASFAMGLLDAAAQANVDRRCVALISYDLPYPAPLHEKRSIDDACGVALLLSPIATGASLAGLDIDLAGGDGLATEMLLPALEILRRNNPSARALPLLAACIAGSGRVIIAGLPGQLLRIEVSQP